MFRRRFPDIPGVRDARAAAAGDDPRCGPGFLRDRKDAVLFGAQAVNAYVKESRMTQDVDIASLHGEEFAEEVRAF